MGIITMKKIFNILFAAVVAMAAISCAKEELNIEKDPVQMVKQTLYAYTDDGLVSKTQLDGRNVVWNEGDAITAFDANGNDYSATVEKSDVVDEEKEGAMGKFTFEVPEGTTLKTAVYPAGEDYTYDGDYIYAELPSVQTAVKGNFADGVNLALANVPSDLTQPFKFSNATGLLCLGVNAEEEALSNLVGIQLYAKENTDEHIAGGVMAELADNKVTCVSDAEDGFEVRNIISLNADSFGQGDYYFCALPGNYGGDANKMKITFFRKDGKVATYTNSNQLALGINDNILIGRLNIPATKWQDNLILDLSIDETSTANADEICWDNPLVNVSATKGSSTDANNYYGATQSSTRFYAGSTLTITPKGNISIAKIEFSATTDGYANAIGDATIWANASVKSNVDKLVTIVPTVGTNNLIANIGATCGFDKITIYFGQPEGRHAITIDEDIPNGSISASSETAFAGEIITLNAIPAQGYEHDTWVVKCGNDDVTVENSKFTMPDGDVMVSATFKERTTPQPQGEVEVFYESFDNNDGKGANDNNGWSGNVASSTIKAIKEGWSFTKGNGAYQCVKFGTASAKGSAETPEIDFQGAEEATLTFKAGLWSGDTNDGLKISATNASVSPESVTLVDAKWSNYEIAISEVKGKVKIKFEASNASKNRFFLDEVRVVTKPTKILNSIAISGEPSQKVYVAGESFNPAGLIVTGTYSDDSEKTITEGITWSCDPEILAAETKTVSVTATVEGKTSDAYEVGVTVSAKVDVTGISLNKTTLTLTDRTPVPLVATIEPSSASNKAVTWTSSNEVVASVDQEGNVTAKSAGETTITATSVDNTDIKATCDVTVNAYTVNLTQPESPKGITISASSNANVFAGDEVTLSYSGAPTGWQLESWSVKYGEEKDITVTHNKFTMPASDVTVSATFSQIEYTISKSSENGTFTVKVNGEESETAYYNDEITLVSTPADGYEFSKFTYKKEGNDYSYQINNNELKMPNSNITITAEFVKGVPTFNSVEEFIQSEEYKSVSGTNQTVKVQFNNVISELYYYSGKVAGVYLKDTDVLIYCNNTPTTYSIGGTISTSEPIVCTWKQYKELKELCPSSWNDFTFTAPKLSSIEITSESHRNFIVGGTFVGESVKAKYDTGYEKEVTATFSGFNMSQAGTQTVTASYTEGTVTKTATYQITVTTPVLESISVSENHRTFNVGDTFVKETVTAHYVGGETQDVTNSATFIGYNMSTPGEQTVTVTYSEMSTSYTINITAAPSFEPGTVLFHETFGDNSGSARDWSDTYSVKSGESSVYNGISYTMTNVKQGKNTTGQTKSGLNQSSAGTNAVFELGPLNVANCTNMQVTYYWKAASTKGTYNTKLYYKTSKNVAYTEIDGSGTGATTFVQRVYNLPEAAQVETLYLKVVWNTSNTQAIIDEFELKIKDN